MSFLSIDVGSSQSRAAVVSSDGKILALHAAAYAPAVGRAGFAEIEAETLLRMTLGAAREAIGSLADAGIEAVCISSHGETVIPVSAEGEALGPAILNIDGRAADEAAWLEKEFGARNLFALTGHTSHAMYPLAKLLWLRRHQPTLFAAAARFHGVTDFLLMRLGLPTYVDYSHASRFMAFDVWRRVWAADLLELANIPICALPIPVQAGTIAGYLDRAAALELGVPTGTPVVVGGHDQVVGAVGMGVLRAGRAAGSLGTYECILVASDQPQLDDAAFQAQLNSYPHAVPDQYVTIGYFPGGIMVRWLTRLLGGAGAGQEGQHLRELEWNGPEGPTGLIVLPHLIGSCNPEFDADAHGVIAGLSIESTVAHLFRGILEGIAAELALITETLERAGCTFSDINVSGGGAGSPLGLRLRAAFTEKYLHKMSCQESVCLGGAVLASVAIGRHPNLDVAVRTMTREQEVVAPDPGLAGEYKVQIDRYRQLRGMLVGAGQEKDRVLTQGEVG
ncbi:MAG: FGGY-family carbohydrate kinase [Acidobacteriaceae bacterium]